MKRLHFTLAALALFAAALFAATIPTPAPSPGTDTATTTPAVADHSAHGMSCHAGGKATAAPAESKGHCQAMKKNQGGGGCCP